METEISQIRQRLQQRKQDLIEAIEAQDIKQQIQSKRAQKKEVRALRLGHLSIGIFAVSLTMLLLPIVIAFQFWAFALWIIGAACGVAGMAMHPPNVKAKIGFALNGGVIAFLLFIGWATGSVFLFFRQAVLE